MLIRSYHEYKNIRPGFYISFGMDWCRPSMFQKNFDMIIAWQIVFTDTSKAGFEVDFRGKKKASRKDWLKGKKMVVDLCAKNNTFSVFLHNSLNIRLSHRDTRILLKNGVLNCEKMVTISNKTISGTHQKEPQ